MTDSGESNYCRANDFCVHSPPQKCFSFSFSETKECGKCDFTLKLNNFVLNRVVVESICVKLRDTCKHEENGISCNCKNIFIEKVVSMEIKNDHTVVIYYNK